MMNNKSQTLPRNMGRSQPVLASHRPAAATAVYGSGLVVAKPSLPLTPPSVKRQLSVPISGACGGNESPMRRRPTTTLTNKKNNQSDQPEKTESGSNRGTPVRKVSAAAGAGLIIKGVEPRLAQLIMDEIVEGGAPVQWQDIAGQEVSIEITRPAVWLTRRRGL